MSLMESIQVKQAPLPADPGRWKVKVMLTQPRFTRAEQFSAVVEATPPYALPFEAAFAFEVRPDPWDSPFTYPARVRQALIEALPDEIWPPWAPI